MDLINELINLIELRDREIKQLKLALLAANTDPNIVQDSDISESIEPKGATTGGLTPHLAMFNPNTLIVLASDSEGNSMSPMDGRLTVASYQPYTSYDGQLVDDDEAVNAVPCLVLWPKR